jgi:hypothetical protein
LSSSGSPLRRVRVALCPVESRKEERIAITLSDDGYLDAYMWNGSVLTEANNIGYVGTTANAYRPFDIAYEKTSGDALLVYGLSSTNKSRDLAYKTYISGSWSTENYLDDTGHGSDSQYYWVELDSNPTSGSNEITMVGLDATDSDANGWVWNDNIWGSMYELDGTISITTEECIAVKYETLSGKAWTAVGSGSTANTFSVRSQTGGTWNSTRTNPNVGGIPNWCTLKSDPSSNYVMLVCLDSGSDLCTVRYSGSGSWTVDTDHDDSVDSQASRCADFAWEPTGGRGLLVWGTTAGQVAYRTFTSPSTWGSQQNIAIGANVHPWIQLRTNPRTAPDDTRIIGVVLEGIVFDLGSIRWDGTSFTVIGANSISSDTTTTSYECFDLEFKNFY